ncbi:hypothetical protein Mal15_04930 [Stieleria maiorica]|uniref:Uncharacterized protein n=1 Tax=Stieleria maiorica TaxID=2795974 RepID=A0A5B9MAB3_9BACT|nr:hypothetical protein [Stieleria maiorica]QEF96465.1 hypothetical protein Mal15_04930 [Stieleria maiorica]
MDLDRDTIFGLRRGSCGRGIVVMVGVLLLSVAVVHAPANAQDRPQQRDSVDRPADDGQNEKRLKKRGRRKRQGKRPKHSATTPAETPIRLQLDGAFQLDLGFGNAIHGKGSITLQLDRATVERLGDESAERLGGGEVVADEFLDVVTRMPEMLRQTAAILELLSKPETQENLRQVEQVLRLLPAGTATAPTP